MDISDYLARMKAFYSSFIKYVENETKEPENFRDFISFVNNNQYGRNSDELRSLLHIINKVSNHHSQRGFLKNQVQKLLIHFTDQIKQTFTNIDIFNIFKNNKSILLFLFENELIQSDEEIVFQLLSKFGAEDSNFFYPEIKPFQTQNSGKYKLRFLKCDEIDDPDFYQKRQEGENGSIVCQLIRKGSLDEFKKYFYEQKMKSFDLIPHSIFETNLYLSNAETSLLEYSAFCGSMEIFQFLLEDDILDPSLWIYAVKGQNIELIELLKKNGIEPENSNYNELFIESVKSHHNEIAKILQSNENCIQKNQLFCFYNFEFFPNDFTNDDYETILDLSCQYDYVTLVKILIETRKIDLQEILKRSAIFIFNFLNEILQFKIFL